MNLPPELRAFAITVALVPPDQWDAFVVAAGRHVSGTPDNVAHAVNAFANQWTRKQRAPNSHVAALLALLDPAKRDRLTAQSWTVKKWVHGNRAAMIKAAAQEATRRWHERINSGCKEFLALPQAEQAAALDAAARALLDLVDTKEGLLLPATTGWQVVQATRDAARRRVLIPCGGLSTTDLGGALVMAHKTGTLETLLTEWAARL
jgi:hypothetical protein